MNCSICGRPLGPDGVCPNCCPTAPITLPKPRKKLTTAAWFAPVGMLVIYLGWIAVELLDTLVLSRIPKSFVADSDLHFKNQILYTCINHSIRLVFAVLAVFLCLLLYKLAASSWKKTLQKALRPIIFVPLAFWALSKSAASLFTGYIYRLFLIRQITNILYQTLYYLFFFVTALLFAVVAFFVVRTLLKRADSRNTSPVRDSDATFSLRFTSASWFIPVAIVLEIGTFLLERVLYSLFFIGIDYISNKETMYYSYDVRYELGESFSSLLEQSSFLVCILTALVLYLIAANKWGKQRRGAYRALVFVPYGLYWTALHLMDFATGLVYAFYRENLIRFQQYSTISSIVSLLSPIVVGLLTAGISIPIAIGMMKKIQAHEDTLTEKEQPAAPVNAPAPGFNGAPAYAQPVYGPAPQVPPQVPPQSPAYSPAPQYSPQTSAYGPAPAYSPAPPYPPQAPAYAPAPAQAAPVQPAPEVPEASAPEAPAPDMPEA